MVEINGVSLLDRQISVIRSLGIEEIIGIGGHKIRYSQKVQN